MDEAARLEIQKAIENLVDKVEDNQVEDNQSNWAIREIGRIIHELHSWRSRQG